MSEFKPEVNTLIEAIKEQVSVAKDGSVTIAEGLYTKNLPEGVTPEVLQQAQAYTTNFIAATGHVFGDAALGAMQTNKQLERIVADIPLIGKDTLAFTFDRSKEVRVPGTDDTRTNYGTLSAKVHVYGTGDRGQFAQVKRDLADRAKAAFGG